MKIERAVRKAIPFIGCFYGKSQGGKTYSALRLATGLANGGKICVLDTENGRASHYADEFVFDTINLDPPFHSSIYLEAIKLAGDQGYSVLIIDSISHEWDGIGGCIERAEESKTATGKFLTGLNKWAKVKSEHRKLMQSLLHSKMHIIFCARAKDLFEQEGVGRDAVITYKGTVPIQEKNFPFEMLTTFYMRDNGIFTLEKCIEGLKNKLSFAENGFITEEHGKTILQWISKGRAVDFRARELKTIGSEISMNEGINGLRKWYTELSKEDKAIVKSSGIIQELQAIAEKYNEELEKGSIEKSTINGLDNIVGNDKSEKDKDLPLGYLAGKSTQDVSKKPVEKVSF